MKIHMDKLKRITDKIFQHFKDLDINIVELQHDFYWNIPKEKLYDTYDKPETFDMGQLEDDLNELIKIEGGQAEPIGYAFVWLASIYRAIGEEVVK